MDLRLSQQPLLVQTFLHPRFLISYERKQEISENKLNSSHNFKFLRILNEKIDKLEEKSSTFKVLVAIVHQDHEAKKPKKPQKYCTQLSKAWRQKLIFL